MDSIDIETDAVEKVSMVAIGANTRLRLNSSDGDVA
jgi:hypothetical protein|tara:strand:+ start:4963 stop:5070 length:108 start_codon:yes stop_codon:yes gene_type:complete